MLTTGNDRPSEGDRTSPRRDLSADPAFGELPNCVALDSSISAAALVLVGYRTTFDGRWILKRGPVQRAVKRGLAERAFWRALDELIQKGLIARRKEANGKQGHGVVVDDALTLP